MKLALLKYSVLLGALSVCVYVLLVKNSFTYTLLYSAIGLSVLFAVLSVIEKGTKKISGTQQHSFVYYTPGMLAKKLIRIGAFTIASIILLFSGIKVLLFGILLLAMLITELAGLFISIRNKLYFLFFEEKAIAFHDDQVKKVFASHIDEIEFRYEIFYLTLKNNQVKLLETEKLDPARRADFIKEFVDWALKNSLSFTSEAKAKLKI